MRHYEEQESGQMSMQMSDCFVSMFGESGGGEAPDSGDETRIQAMYNCVPVWSWLQTDFVDVKSKNAVGQLPGATTKRQMNRR